MTNHNSPLAKILISYAHEDREWMERLRSHLSLTKRDFNVQFDLWDDTRINTGEDWRDEIEKAIDSCQVAILLVSRHFFDSDFIMDIEVPKLLDSKKNTGKTIFPIILSPCRYNDSLLKNIQARNSLDNTLSKMYGNKGNPDELDAFLSEVAKTIEDVVLENKVSSSDLGVRLQRGNDKEERYNVAVIGKTGVGKSSLINYLFGWEVRRTGVGKPTTMGFECNEVEIDNLPFRFFDSWGLEVNKHKKWLVALNEELKIRGTDRPVEEWFHTILFCIAAGNHRIEDFEIEIIQRLIDHRYKVVVVLTKADQATLEEQHCLVEILSEAFGEEVYCVPVCSVEKRLPFGTTKKEGAIALMALIQAGFWDSITRRVPRRCIDRLEQEIDQWGLKQTNYIATNIRLTNAASIDKTVRERMERYAQELDGQNGMLVNTIQEEIHRAISAYSRFSQTIGHFNAKIENVAPTLGSMEIDETQVAKGELKLLITGSKAMIAGGIGIGGVMLTISYFIPGVNLVTAGITALAASSSAYWVGTSSLNVKLKSKVERFCDDTKKAIRPAEREIESVLLQAKRDYLYARGVETSLD